MKFIRDLFSEGSKLSTMRVSVFSIIFVCVIIGLSTAGHIIYKTIGDKTIDWSGVAVLVGVLATPVLSALGAKAFQKRFENK